MKLLLAGGILHVLLYLEFSLVTLRFSHNDILSSAWVVSVCMCACVCVCAYVHALLMAWHPV